MNSSTFPPSLPIFLIPQFLFLLLLFSLSNLLFHFLSTKPKHFHRPDKQCKYVKWQGTALKSYGESTNWNAWPTKGGQILMSLLTNKSRVPGFPTSHHFATAALFLSHLLFFSFIFVVYRMRLGLYSSKSGSALLTLWIGHIKLPGPQFLYLKNAVVMVLSHWLILLKHWEQYLETRCTA